MPDPVLDPAVDPAPAPTPGAAPAPSDPPADPPADQGGDPAPGAPTPLNTPPGQDPGAGAPAPEGSGEGSVPWYQGDQLPPDWREQLAGEDTKTLNMLKRVDGISTLVKNYVEAQETIRKGVAPGNDGPPEDPEKLAAWRTEKGIPTEPGAYELELDEGLVISDEDRKDLGTLFETFHGMNLNSKQASELVNNYYRMEGVQKDRLAAQDNLDLSEARSLMQQNWGGDFETNMNMIQSLISQEFPSDLVEELYGARMASGKGLFNDPAVLAGFAKIARLVNPTAALVPSGSNPVQTINDEIAALEKRMGEPGWHKDAAAQSRYQELITARDTLKARHGG